MLCVTVVLYTADTVSDFAIEFRIGLIFSVVLIVMCFVIEWLLVISSERAQRATVWILYCYFTVPLALLCANMWERATSPLSHEIFIFAILLVLPAAMRLCVLTYIACYEFLNLEEGASVSRRRSMHIFERAASQSGTKLFDPVQKI